MAGGSTLLDTAPPRRARPYSPDHHALHRAAPSSQWPRSSAS
eukprot:CAMPEP_0182551474 /NCGR_PEP_ID=MMETSP1323-20130603/45099_1 /TAXON_ID=236787 /ORGANISM="Florenciella parvula, Strain RCC1693" /LENGTH=41 /DNA_ID= /DNA_START= /DNA_END= /DNA_ORIENTATION=